MTTVFTIGHSTRSLPEFIDLLKSNRISMVVDIRTIPRSRHNPQFNRETLPASLQEAGIGYVHLGGLGGLRHPRPDSPNAGWRNASFRGFADYMQADEYEEAIRELVSLAEREQVVIMCAEAVPWRCHRSLISDTLSVRGIRVRHILSATSTPEHTLTPWARVEGGRVWYPAGG